MEPMLQKERGQETCNASFLTPLSAYILCTTLFFMQCSLPYLFSFVKRFFNFSSSHVAFRKLWLAAEVVLFVLVGAAVDIRYTASAGASALLMIGIALLFRAAGVFLCMPGTQLNKKERLFCVIAYLPKATVQAAVGSVPLSLGLPCGQLVLSVAVLAILVTAPIGAIGMDKTYRRLLVQEGGAAGENSGT